MKLGKINRQGIAVSGFTSILHRYDAMPSELYIAGKLPTTRIPAVAIIGSRRPTKYGEEVTYKLAYDLARSGVIVISGLAYGIDAIAHRAALDAGGSTIAVLAGGLHKIYPVAHTRLAEEIIAKGGAIISEQEEGYDARPYDFLARNRLVSGLADAVLVTEATNKSGTFSTVSHAMAQNKDIFAVPGPITSLLSAGPNRILQDGAHVTLAVDDILDIIAPTHKTQPQQLPLGMTPLETAIISLMQEGERDGEVLQARVIAAEQATTSEVLQALTMLELSGVIRAAGGNHWQLR